ncbi:DUF819 family protein, partial [Pseudomaricurvus alkylphenolicus]
AAFATVVGAFVAVRMVDLGPDEGVLAGIMTAGYIGGSANTAAMAVSKGWHNLTTPALLCGVFGYALANFIGISLSALL